MLTRRTIIGLVVGSVIVGIGAYSMVSDIGFQQVDVDETLGVGESTSFQINSNQGGTQAIKITGERFDTSIQMPGQEEASKESHEGQMSREWIHQNDGTTRLTIQNTGSSDLQVEATFQITTDPILFIYHIMVITSGMVIIGFSAGFTMRKPKGF